jgi:hypothetical protein
MVTTGVTKKKKFQVEKILTVSFESVLYIFILPSSHPEYNQDLFLS